IVISSGRIKSDGFKADLCNRPLIQQVLRTQQNELVQPIAPVFGDTARIFAGLQSLKRHLVRQQGVHLRQVELLRIELVQRRSQLNAQLRSVEGLAVDEDNLHSSA